MGMSLQQLDQVLESWKTRLSHVAENLLALQADATYQSFTGTGGLEQVHLIGETAVRVESVTRTMHGLFVQFGLLQSRVDQAEALRKKLPSLVGSEAKMRELESLLLSTPVEIETAEVPLAERHLLGGAQVARRMLPEELLELMTRTFDEVRRAVAAVETAWTAFAEGADQIGGELTRLRSQIAMPSRLLAPALDNTEEQLRDACNAAPTDPLRALQTLRTRVEPALARANQQVALADSLAQQIRAARSRLETLKAQHGEVKHVLQQAGLKFTGQVSAAKLMPEETLDALEQWLNRLDRKRDEGVGEALAIGLRNWCSAAERCMAEERSLRELCEAQLAARSELRGRLEALKAKAKSRGVDTSLPLSGLRKEAEVLLYAHPMDLGVAARAVSFYEQHLDRSSKARRAAVADGQE